MSEWKVIVHGQSKIFWKAISPFVPILCGVFKVVTILMMSSYYNNCSLMQNWSLSFEAYSGNDNLFLSLMWPREIKTYGQT